MASYNPDTGKQLRKRVTIDPCFDEIKKKKDREARQEERYNQTTYAQKDPLELTSKIIKEIVLPLTGKDGKSGGTDKTLNSIMEGFTTMMTTGFKKMQGALVESQLEKMKLINEKPADPEPEDKTGAIINGVLSVIDRFGDMFKNAKGAQADLLKQMVQNDPRYNEVSEDPDLIDAIYTEGCERVGKQTMDEIFQKLGFEVPPDEKPPEESEKKEEPEKANAQ